MTENKRRCYFKVNMTAKQPEVWEHARALNRVYLKRFFLNARFILRGAKVSQLQVKNDLFTRYGFVVAKDSVNRYIRNEHYNNVSLNYLQFFCLYLQEPLDKMLSEDYSKLADYSPKLRGAKVA